MTNFLIIGICIIAGMLFQRSKMLPVDAHKGINAWVIYLGIPAVSFKYIPHIQWSSDFIMPVIAPIVVWFAGWLFVRIYATYTDINKTTEGGMKLASSLSNTSFIGFPLIMAYYSENDIGTAVISDQISFLLLSTAGVIVAVNSSKSAKLTAGVIINKVVKFPPFLGCMGALFIPQFWDVTPLNPLFDRLASTVGPLALFSIGLQLRFEGWQSQVKHISASLFYKLIIAPALVFSIALLFGFKGRVTQISIFEMAMPSFVSVSLVAAEYKLNTQLTNLIIAIGILLGFITTGIWWYILQMLG